jgi:hypothetical protein
MLALLRTGEELTLQRLAVLNFSAAAALPPEQVLLHYLIAACDSADAAGMIFIAARPHTTVAVLLPLSHRATRIWWLARRTTPAWHARGSTSTVRF